jgi:Uma2 family endonuclease
VADSSLAFDRDQKGGLYARAGIPDYWIVNLRDRVLEVHRERGPDVAAPHGWRYAAVMALAPPAVVSPLAPLSVQIAIADLLP